MSLLEENQVTPSLRSASLTVTPVLSPSLQSPSLSSQALFPCSLHSSHHPFCLIHNWLSRAAVFSRRFPIHIRPTLISPHCPVLLCLILSKCRVLSQVQHSASELNPEIQTLLLLISVLLRASCLLWPGDLTSLSFLICKRGK